MIRINTNDCVRFYYMIYFPVHQLRSCQMATDGWVGTGAQVIDKASKCVISVSAQDMILCTIAQFSNVTKSSTDGHSWLRICGRAGGL